MMIRSNQLQASRKSGFQRGALAPDVIIALTQLNQCLEQLTFSRYLPSPSFEERLANSPSPQLRDIHREADRLRNLTGIDLLHWESIVAASWPRSEFRLLFSEALSHDSKKEVSGTFQLTVEEIAGERFQEQLTSLAEEDLLAICSTCKLKDGALRHIPLMDFHCSPNPINLEKVTVALTEMNQRGVILESGRSYHFYGYELLDQNQWITFMAKALLLAPFADSRYIAHRLLGGKSVLRISRSKRKPQVPFVVATVE